MAGASAMPDLEEDATLGGMDGIGHLFPGRGMSRGVDARLRPEGRVPGHGHGRLGNQQAGTRPLGIVFGHQGVGEVFLTRPAAGEGRHEDPVGGGDGANAQGVKRSGIMIFSQVGGRIRRKQDSDLS
jgi:hypothetical protein